MKSDGDQPAEEAVKPVKKKAKKKKAKLPTIKEETEPEEEEKEDKKLNLRDSPCLRQRYWSVLKVCAIW